MAVDCVAAFENENTLIRTLSASTPYSGTIANQFEGAFFKFELTENETIFFSLNIQPNTTQAINVEFTLYRKDGAVFTNLGTSISDDFNNNFNYSATPAEYYICISTDFSIDYTLEADFTDFPFVLIAECDAYHGAYTPPVEFAPQTAVCDSPVFYTIIEGELPAGLEFAAEGIITGTPLEQDCENAAADAPPSFTWYEENEETGNHESTGLTHRIVIRAALLDAPETYADREFFICIHNNWDNDRDHFISLRPSWETPVFVRPEDAPTLEPDPVIEPPLELVSDCPVKEPEVPTQATLEELQELAKMVVINEEFQGIVKINTDGICEVCDDEVDTNTLQLTPLPEPECVECEEPVTEQVIKPIPESMCPQPAEEAVEVEEVRFVPGIPVNCFPELLKKMHNDKVCYDRPECPPVSPIYPEVVEDEKIKLQSSCPPPCEE